MTFKSFVVVLLFAFSRAAAEGGSDEEMASTAASPGNSEEKVSNLLPEGADASSSTVEPTPALEGRGRSDIDIEEEKKEEKPFGGYFYPRPGRAFELPAFKTLNADASFSPEKDRTSRRVRSLPPHASLYPSHHRYPGGYRRPHRPSYPLRPLRV